MPIPHKSSRTKQIEAAIEQALTDQPGMMRPELASKVSTKLGYTIPQVAWNIQKMAESGGLDVDRSNARLYRYFVAGGKMNQKTVKAVRSAQIDIFGPPRSPMLWMINVLGQV